jgi:iron complex outermembrane recepter protein
MHKKILSRWMTSACFVAVMSPSMALAQDEVPASESNAQQLQEIVVTAQKRSQNLKDVPISITVLDSTSLANQRIQDVDDITRVSANIFNTTADDVKGNPVSVRGVQTFTNTPAIDQSLAVYVDEVYQGGNVGSQGSLFDIEQVELLRGPQGTLFGRNALAGALNIRTMRPGNDLIVKGSIGYGNYNALEVRGLVNVPIVEDKVALKVSGNYVNRDGFIRNIANQDRVNDSNQWGLRAQALIRPIESIEALITYERREIDNKSPAFDPFRAKRGTAAQPFPNATLNDIFAGLGLYAGPPIGRSFTVDGFDRLIDQDAAPRQKVKSDTASLNLKFELPIADFRWITSYRKYNLEDRFDGDLSPYPLIISTRPEAYRAWTQELRLESNTDGPFSWIVGAMYHNQRTFNGSGSINTQIFTDSLLRLIGQTPQGAGLVALLNNIPGGTVATPLQAPATIDVDSYAAFAHTNYKLSDRLDLTIGGRFTHEQKDLQFEQRNSLVNAIVFNLPIIGLSQAKTSYSDFSPTLSLGYDVSDAVRGYASVSKGFKGGGFNDFVVNNTTGGVTLLYDLANPATYGNIGRATYAPISFKKEQIWNYEVGLKGFAFDRRLQFDLAAFYMNWKDRQFFNSSVTSGFAVAVVNCCDLDVYGFEADLRALVADGLTLRASGGYNKNKVRSTTLPAQIAKGSSLDFLNPRYNFSVGLDYERGIGNVGTMLFSTTYNYRGKYDVSQVTDQVATDSYVLNQSAFGLLDATLKFTTKDERWSVSLWGKNLFDKKYLAGFYQSVYQAPFVGLSGVNLGEPRTYGVEANFQF